VRIIACLVFVALGFAPCVRAQSPANPILFVTQFPIGADFATIGSVFANHRGDISLVGRGGDLYIRYPDGTLRNLTAEAGFGSAGVSQGANAIAVRDPAVHWSGTKAVFSMVIGAPTQQFQFEDYWWQLYEVTGFGVGETVSVTRVQGQPADYNNVAPTYASDGSIIYVSDRPRSGQRHLYPQHDEYESTATPTGLWKLTAGGEPTLLQHSPSGSFTPFVDRYGRVVFTRWDHLQRDQQNDNAGNPYGTFNYASEAADAAALVDRSEVFPEPRDPVPGSNLNGLRMNHFFPWALNQDGTGEETLNHIGRHELHNYFANSITDDPNLFEFIAEVSGRTNPRAILNTLYLREDPTAPGRYIGIDAPEFGTNGSGQVIRFSASPSTNPDDVQVEYLTHRDTEGTTPSPNHTGHYRNPLVLSDGTILVAHTATQGPAGDDGTRESPQPRYQFRLRRLAPVAGGLQGPGTTLLAAPIVRSVAYWDPDVRVAYNGPLWELSPVEVVARAVPPATAQAIAAPEQQAFALEGVDPQQYRAWLSQRGLAVMVMRNVTTRDDADRQQPFNLRVPGGVSTVGAGGRVYDVAHMQFFQGDQIRGIGGPTSPSDGRRVLAQHLHDPSAVAANLPNPGGPAASTAVHPDGSVAFYVPTRRALTWQLTAPNGTPVVRERFWISAQPGEVRACDGCHGVNRDSQSGAGAAQNVALAFRELLAAWRTEQGVLLRDGFE
jgi:hypothetical protein